MFTIGEFSRIVGLPIKTLRFYHEEGLLVPAAIDPRSNYRYYNERNFEEARLIIWLRGLEFPVSDIRDLLRESEQEGKVLAALERHEAVIDQRARELKRVSRSLRQFIEREKRLQSAIASFGQTVQEKTLPPMLVAAVRMKAPYNECGKGFARIGRRLGRLICGPPLLLHHDTEYQDSADYEACFPIRQSKPADGIDVRELPGVACASLLHTGPYDEMGPSYAAVLKHVRQRGHAVAPPTREVYLKRPGMIFKGNPRNYVTEIQIPLEPSASKEKPCDASHAN